MTDTQVTVKPEMQLASELEEKKPEKKPNKDKEGKEKRKADVVVPLGLTLLCKNISDGEDDGLVLVGTMIQRIVSDDVDEFPIRINELKPPEGAIDGRRSRTLEIKNLDKAGDEVKISEQTKGICITSNVKLPLSIRPDESVSYPFKMLKASLKFEFSTITKDDIQYRPTIMEPVSEEHFREFICLKHHLKPGADSTKDPVLTYNEIEFDKSLKHDTVNPVPVLKMAHEKKDKVIYWPKFEAEWTVQAPFVQPLISTLVPAAVLLALQWINWIVVLRDGQDTGAYFTNAITIVLALVVVIPQMKDDSTGLRNNLTPIDLMIFLFFIGTALSAYPNDWTSFIGLLITSCSLLFPGFGIERYISSVTRIKTTGPAIKNLLPISLSEKAQGEILDFAKLKLRPSKIREEKEKS